MTDNECYDHSMHNCYGPPRPKGGMLYGLWKSRVGTRKKEKESDTDGEEEPKQVALIWSCGRCGKLWQTQIECDDCCGGYSERTWLMSDGTFWDDCCFDEPPVEPCKHILKLMCSKCGHIPGHWDVSEYYKEDKYPEDREEQAQRLKERQTSQENVDYYNHKKRTGKFPDPVESDVGKELIEGVFYWVKMRRGDLTVARFIQGRLEPIGYNPVAVENVEVVSVIEEPQSLDTACGLCEFTNPGQPTCKELGSDVIENVCDEMCACEHTFTTISPLSDGFRCMLCNDMKEHDEQIMRRVDDDLSIGVCQCCKDVPIPDKFRTVHSDDIVKLTAVPGFIDDSKDRIESIRTRANDDMNAWYGLGGGADDVLFLLGLIDFIFEDGDYDA